MMKKTLALALALAAALRGGKDPKAAIEEAAEELRIDLSHDVRANTQATERAEAEGWDEARKLQLRLVRADLAWKMAVVAVLLGA